MQFEDWFRLAGDPSVHSAVSVLLDCLLSSYSFSYVEKKSLERQRNRTGGHPLSPRTPPLLQCMVRTGSARGQTPRPAM